MESKLISTFTVEMLGCVARLIGQLAKFCYDGPGTDEGEDSEEGDRHDNSKKDLAGVLICTAHAILEARNDEDSRGWAIRTLAKLAKKNTALQDAIATHGIIEIIMGSLESR